MSVWTIVVAAGRGDRFGGDKQSVGLLDRPVLVHSVSTAAKVSTGVVVVAAADRQSRTRDLLVGIKGTIEVVSGGSTRSASVRSGLAMVPDVATVVIVHDGARPLASLDLFQRVVSNLRQGVDAVVPGIPVTDSLREINGGMLERKAVVAVQTPQAFNSAALRSAHALGIDALDDASLVEAAGGKVVIVEGEVANLKITFPFDLAMAKLLLLSNSDSDFET